MPDLSTISAAVASLKAIIDLVKNANDGQLAMKISSEVAQIQGRLLETQQQALELQEENRELRDEIRELKQAVEENAGFQVIEGVYWKNRYVLGLDLDEEGNRIRESSLDGPFCPTCKEANNKAVRMRKLGVHEGKRRFYCDIHRIEFYISFAP